MRVSTLIPCYNAAQWIFHTIESALAIDWDDHEIIVVDDGSQDGSAEIVERFHDKRIVLLRQKNKGASSARNRAFQESSGDFIQYLDADDIIAPDKIRIQMQRLASSPPDTVASGDWGRFTQSVENARFIPSSLQADLSGLEFLTRYCDTGDMMQPSAWLVPSRLIHKVGPWNESLSLNDDGEFFARVVLAANSIRYCPGARCFYRSIIHNSLSKRQDTTSLKSLFHSIELTTRYLLEKRNDASTRQAVANCWKRIAWEIYPGLPREANLAITYAQTLGGATRPMPMPGKVRFLSHFIGWKLSRRLQVATRSRHANIKP